MINAGEGPVRYIYQAYQDTKNNRLKMLRDDIEITLKLHKEVGHTVQTRQAWGIRILENWSLLPLPYFCPTLCHFVRSESEGQPKFVSYLQVYYSFMSPP